MTPKQPRDMSRLILQRRLEMHCAVLGIDPRSPICMDILILERRQGLPLHEARIVIRIPT